MRAELRRSIFLACVGLLAGFALVVTLYGASTLFKRSVEGTDRDRAALAAAPTAPTEEARPGAVPGSSAQAEPDPRPGEGASPAGKPPAARAVRQPPAPGLGASAGTEAPTFDIIRVEPNGETVIAGRAAPNTTVELLRDNAPIARALVDPSGQFAIVPPALPVGNSEITLRASSADGQERVSRDSVAVVVAPDRRTKPLIALTSPDKPTIVLSQPDPVATAAAPGSGAAESRQAEARSAAADNRLAMTMPGPGGQNVPGLQQRADTGTEARSGQPGAAAPDPTAPLKIVSVEAEDGGRLYVTSQAPPGATVRLYLNDALVAPGSVGADGRVAFTIGRGVQPGAYTIRVDQVDPVSGKVKTRSEVPFTVPVAAKPGTPTASASPARSPGAKLAQGPAVPAPGTPGTPAALPAAMPRMAVAKPPAPPESATPASQAPAGRAEAPDTPARAATERSPSVFVPEVGTARIIRGDSLWQISRRIYGTGTRYTVIYDANQPQIRNPDLIYPGQIFVLPGDGTAAVPQTDPRG
ncbi:hypothetical protein ASF60_07250 [Methylobacterium sp. Leaf113]|uniref:LysM peptidoglycan-binding domain-containing protein n=1 Tax=unclassified Methylobacterium TaxID=2615210 RepID=UPI0006F4F67E|nr:MULTISPECIES: LysM peptidoglycan-binding domain-containing protein [unclassified Methylobacterium]KQP77729.1 hypothetical protein ASF60_07250 [Methylobacterium sp. Leaf113]KQP83256.1 hypothetical protein ASF57_14490 [Methylobacterium sp. Leaf117]